MLAGFPRLDDVAIEPIVLLFALAVSLAAGVLFSLVPIARFTRPDLATALKESGRGGSDGRERHRIRHALVAAQVALAIVLLVGSALMLRTFIAILVMCSPASPIPRESSPRGSAFRRR